MNVTTEAFIFHLSNENYSSNHNFDRLHSHPFETGLEISRMLIISLVAMPRTEIYINNNIKKGKRRWIN